MTLTDISGRRRAFGERLVTLRRSRGFSQERLALASDMDRSYVGRIERGEQSVSLDKIFALSDALGIDPVELFS
ncbi:helix-turn-helix domain-containing protein [Bifidobacterium breve]|uniref:helix-turn-helix domain-containing protein n=1 Tax=Bifidobacterium breve TaxID=1685 RepID=UPI0035671690